MVAEVIESLTPAQRRFCATVSQSWFPPNPEVVARVRAGLRGGEYRSNRALLIEHLRLDSSLFLIAVRELSQALQREKPLAGPELHPRHLIESAPDALLEVVLDRDPSEMARLPYHAGVEASGRRLFQSMLSATVASMLAEVKGEDTDLAFSCALFRQLGLALIAWNHPHVYGRVLANLGAEDSLDEVLARALGISPTSLGLVLAREWRVSPVLRAGMGDSVPDESPETKMVGQRLQNLCRAGELLSRAQEPGHSPQRLKDFSEACAHIQLLLGPQGFRLVLERVEQACRHYKRFCPEFFEPAIPATPTVGSAAIEWSKFLSDTLPPFFCDQLLALAKKFESGGKPEQLRPLLEQIVRSMGFSAGGLYLLEPSERIFLPRLALAGEQLARLPSVHLEGGRDDDNPVVAAWKSADVVVGGRARAFVAARFGQPTSMGVLYLEINRELFDPRQEVIVECVRALREVVGYLLIR